MYDAGLGQCNDNSTLLRGLTRSVGLEGIVLYFWNGTAMARHMFFFQNTAAEKNFRIPEIDPKDAVPDYPHFRFHAVVSAEGHLYDPSYGKLRDDGIQFDESLFIADPSALPRVGQWFYGNEHQMTGPVLPGALYPTYPSDYVCSHPQ